MTKKRLWLYGCLSLALVVGVAMVATVGRSDAKSLYGYSVFRVDGGWGYDVSHNGKTVIHQPFVPEANGRQAFADRSSAREAAMGVINKLELGATAFPF